MSSLVAFVLSIFSDDHGEHSDKCEGKHRVWGKTTRYVILNMHLCCGCIFYNQSTRNSQLLLNYLCVSSLLVRFHLIFDYVLIL